MMAVNRTLLAFILVVALAVPIGLLGAALGFGGWALTLLTLPAMFVASLVDRDGFYGTGD